MNNELKSVILDIKRIYKKSNSKTFSNLKPPNIVTSHIGMNKYASIISNHIGLNDHKFLIAFAAQKKGTAGSYENTYSKTPNIELCPSIKDYPDCCAATICHEMSHHWLNINYIKYSNTLQNEFLTDICVFYLGLGKVYLNGFNKLDKYRGPATPYLNRENLNLCYLIKNIIIDDKIDDFEGLSSLSKSKYNDTLKMYEPLINNYKNRYSSSTYVDFNPNENKILKRANYLLNNHNKFFKAYYTKFNNPKDKNEKGNSSKDQQSNHNKTLAYESLNPVNWYQKEDIISILVGLALVFLFIIFLLLPFVRLVTD